MTIYLKKRSFFPKPRRSFPKKFSRTSWKKKNGRFFVPAISKRFFKIFLKTSRPIFSSPKLKIFFKNYWKHQGPLGLHSETSSFALLKAPYRRLIAKRFYRAYVRTYGVRFLSNFRRSLKNPRLPLRNLCSTKIFTKTLKPRSLSFLKNYARRSKLPSSRSKVISLKKLENFSEGSSVSGSSRAFYDQLLLEVLQKSLPKEKPASLPQPFLKKLPQKAFVGRLFRPTFRISQTCFRNTSPSPVRRPKKAIVELSSEWLLQRVKRFAPNYRSKNSFDRRRGFRRPMMPRLKAFLLGRKSRFRFRSTLRKKKSPLFFF